MNFFRRLFGGKSETKSDTSDQTVSIKNDGVPIPPQPRPARELVPFVLPAPEEVGPELRRLILEGRKIEAIRVYRGVTGLDLQIAKNDVEALIDEIEQEVEAFGESKDEFEIAGEKFLSRERQMIAFRKQFKLAIEAGDKESAAEVYMEATGEEAHQAYEAVDEAIESGRMADFRLRPAKPLPSKSEDVTEKDVMNAIRQGNKIQAIKLYRQMTGMGLKESKTAVEKLMSDGAGSGSIKPSRVVERDIVTALRNGNKIQAVKLYRQMSGLGLKESKEAVEELQRKFGL